MTDTKRACGFAALDPKRLRQISSLGGQAARDQGVGHRWTKAEASVAGKRGAVASLAARARRAGQPGSSVTTAPGSIPFAAAPPAGTSTT